MNTFEMGRRKILGVARFSMLFACGVGTGLFFYGVAEPIYHYTSGWPSSSSSSFYWHHHHHHPFLSPTSITKGKSHHINIYRTCWWTTSWPLSSKQSTSKSSQLFISDFPLSTWDEHSCTFSSWLQLLYSYPSQDGTGSVQTQVWLTTIWHNKHSTSLSTIGD